MTMTTSEKAAEYDRLTNVWHLDIKSLIQCFHRNHEYTLLLEELANLRDSYERNNQIGPYNALATLIDRYEGYRAKGSHAKQ